jgi:cytochrome c biogenesis protein CcmG, thiol:disulfide interchange protein DsbE
LFAGMAAAVSVARKSSRPAAPLLLSPAPGFAVSDLGGTVTTLSSLKGKIVLLNFWASWCTTCKDEVPDLENLHTKLKGKGFTVLGLSVDEGGKKPVMAFVARFNPTFPVALADRKTAEAYGVFGLPVSYLIDRDGVIRKRYQGPIDAPAVENDILRL